MNSRERVDAILNRQPVDRIPVDFWLAPELMEQLKKEYQTQDDIELYRKLDVDKLVWVGPGYTGKKPELMENATSVNCWGVQYTKFQVNEKAAYPEAVNSPLLDCEDVDDILAYEYWPDPADFDYDAAAEYAKRAHKDFYTLGPWISIFEIYCAMRSQEEALVDVLCEPEIVNATLDRIEEIQTEMMKRFFAKAGDAVDMVFISDDLGSQTNLIISPEVWKQFIAPRLKRWCDFLHAEGKKVFYHSDGACEKLLPDLIEAGIDILNPIQHVCQGMDRAELKAKYGNQVIFHGGVENQKILPFGTAEEVAEETRTCLETLGAGNEGYICASCHIIQADTPLENVHAMIDTVKAFTG